jgi:hypothetical protein
MHAKTQLKVKDRKHTLNWYNKTKFIALYQIFFVDVGFDILNKIERELL